MSRFDPLQPTYVPHAGTFNNNVASLAAGVEVLSNVYTAVDAVAFTARGEDFRRSVAAVVARHPSLPLSITGYGTMMVIHARRVAPTDGPSAAERDADLQELLYLGMLARRVLHRAERHVESEPSHHR